MTRRYIPGRISPTWESVQRWIALAAPILNSQQGFLSDDVSAAQASATAAASAASAAQSTASQGVSDAAIADAKAEAAQSAAESAAPSVGDFRAFGGTLPDGWLACDGSAVLRTTYSGLFAEIGTTYGSGDGTTTFNLPKAFLVVAGTATGDVSLDDISKATFTVGIKT